MSVGAVGSYLVLGTFVAFTREERARALAFGTAVAGRAALLWNGQQRRFAE